MTRQEVIDELKDICAVIPEDGELVAEDSLDVLATKLIEEGSEDLSEAELDAINEMIYDSFVDPETVCNELINMLMSSGTKVEDIEDPLTADMWDDLTDEEIAARTSDDGVNWAEYPDHEYQEGCDGKDCTEDLTEEKNLSIDSIEGRVQAYQNEIKAISDMTKDGIEDDLISVVTEMYEDGNTSLDYRDEKEVLSWIKKNSKLSAEEFFKKLVDQMNDLIDRLQKSETVKEAYYGKDSIIAGDIPGKTNTFYSLLVMRFNNMGYDEVNHPLLVGKYEWDWNPFGDDSLVMFGPSEEFFDKIVRYIESEVTNEGSAWYNRDYEVCQVEGRMANPDNFKPGYAGPWALCIEAKEYDRQIDDISDIPLPADVRAEYARRRKIRRGTKPAA